MSYNGLIEENVAKLSWITSSETNADYYEVRWSDGTKPFQAIGYVNAAGTTTDINTYSFETKELTYGDNFFQLVQFDFDGTLNDMGFVSLKYESPNTTGIIYDFENQTAINLTNDWANDIMSVYQLDGKLITSVTLFGSSMSLGSLGLSQGIYLIRINNSVSDNFFRIIVR